MTPKQIYNDLAKIAGHNCSDGAPFLFTKKVLQRDLKVLQSRLHALMEKVAYDRTWRDFGRPATRRYTDNAYERVVARIARENRERAQNEVTISQGDVPSPIQVRSQFFIDPMTIPYDAVPWDAEPSEPRE